MTVWLIVAIRKDGIRMPFEMAFETEQVAMQYIDLFGNPGWQAVPVTVFNHAYTLRKPRYRFDGSGGMGGE